MKLIDKIIKNIERIQELTRKSNESEKLSDEETIELDSMQELYPQADIEFVKYLNALSSNTNLSARDFRLIFNTNGVDYLLQTRFCHKKKN
ncbi:MAG: hypothetical protein LBS81_00295 [Endomicrobium sp.]|jgi:hypothetical protein|nr:hypothetical protein [Endomicrobium sp.]